MNSRNIIVDEFGINFVMSTGFDMSQNTSLSVEFLKPDCMTRLSVPAVLGANDLQTTLGTFSANTWAFYRFVDGDLDQTGLWKAQLIYEDATPAKLFSSIVEFEVEDKL